MGGYSRQHEENFWWWYLNSALLESHIPCEGQQMDKGLSKSDVFELTRNISYSNSVERTNPRPNLEQHLKRGVGTIRGNYSVNNHHELMGAQKGKQCERGRGRDAKRERERQKEEYNV